MKSVPGRVSTEVDARLAYDTPGIVNEVRLCFNATWEEVLHDRCSSNELFYAIFAGGLF